jgi:hypothetical protein
MSELLDARTSLLDTIFAKHVEGKLRWVPRSEADSFETSVGDFIYHLDRRLNANKVVYKLWIFDSFGGDVDNFFARQVESKRPNNDQFDNYWEMMEFMYEDIQEKATLERLAPALAQLKNA